MKSALGSPLKYLSYNRDTRLQSPKSELAIKICRRAGLRSSWVAIWILSLWGSSIPGHAGLIKPDVDYANYQTPLQVQMVNRIKAKITARLGPGENRRDRYFIIPFAYQNKGNSPNFSHSFISVIRVLADQRQPKYTAGLKRGSHGNRNFEAFTISWLPRDFDKNPNLCVFDGTGSRINASLNQCRPVVGRSFTLPETLKLAVNEKVAVGMWGPYEIRKEAFDLGVKRKRLLDRGSIKYIADDRLYRKNRVAINCFHAMAGLEQLYPNGGFLGTGWRMWGIDGTARVLIEYTKAVHNQGAILEPVDYKKDLYGFVYAPAVNSRGVYNPFRNASAYHD
jgi:hypothetical protein